MLNYSGGGGGGGWGNRYAQPQGGNGIVRGYGGGPRHGTGCPGGCPPGQTCWEGACRNMGGGGGGKKGGGGGGSGGGSGGGGGGQPRYYVDLGGVSVPHQAAPATGQVATPPPSSGSPDLFLFMILAVGGGLAYYFFVWKKHHPKGGSPLENVR